MEFSTSFGFSSFERKCPNWIFGAKKYQLSNLLTKFCLQHILKVLISNLTFVFISHSNPQIREFGTQKDYFLILATFCLYTIWNKLISNLKFAFCDSFAKQSKYYGLNHYFFQDFYCKYDI